MHDGLCEVKLHASAELYWMTVVGAGRTLLFPVR